MGDLNTDLISRTGYDNRALQTMIGDLGLVSCADARWPASSCVFKTAGEAAIRTRWHAAVRAALPKRIKRRDVWFVD